MTYKDKASASNKLIFEVEFIGSLEHFDECELKQYVESFIQVMCHAMWQKDQNFKATYCVKDKPIFHNKKTHSEVQLPKLNGARK